MQRIGTKATVGVNFIKRQRQQQWDTGMWNPCRICSDQEYYQDIGKTFVRNLPAAEGSQRKIEDMEKKTAQNDFISAEDEEEY